MDGPHQRAVVRQEALALAHVIDFTAEGAEGAENRIFFLFSASSGFSAVKSFCCVRARERAQQVHGAELAGAEPSHKAVLFE